MDVEQLKRDVAAGKVGIDQLVKLVVVLAGECARLQAKVRELEEKLAGRNPTERLDQSFSVQAEENRQERQKKKRSKKRKPLRRGRLSTADKVKLAQRTESVYPLGSEPAECEFSHTRVAWRMEEGQTILVAYQIYRRGRLYGKPEGLLGRSEYGIEIILSLAYQVYIVGISIDKACALLKFFQHLSLSKSQADSMLNQLARCWESEFEYLCTLLANSAVVHCDETSWSIKSLWAFATDQLTVMFYGVHKDGATLKEILNKEEFKGLLVSDDAAVYQGFTHAQKCWAHLLRKAIKLTIRSGSNKRYRNFTDLLLGIYRDAKRIAADGRLSKAGREARVGMLDDRILELVEHGCSAGGDPRDEVEAEYRLLCHELLRLMLIQELFVFVTAGLAEGTNNTAERVLRDDTTARATGRASKTPRGARRRSVIASVLKSIGKQLTTFTLSNVIDEIKKWQVRGRSCFQEQAEKLGHAARKSAEKILDRLMPKQKQVTPA